MAEGGEYGDDREQVRAVVEIGVEGAQRGFLGGDEAAVALRGDGFFRRLVFRLWLFVELRKAGSGLHQDVHYRDVGLKGGRVQTGQPHIPEKRSGHQEVGGGAPVAFDVKGRG